MTIRISAILTLLCMTMPATAQHLTLDSCRSMAMRNNRQLSATRMQSKIALNVKKAARTKYLPRITAIGGYELMSREVSLLSRTQQGMLNNIGTTMVTGMSGSIADCLTSFVEQGLITPDAAMKMQQTIGQQAGTMAEAGNQYGQAITEAFKTDTRQIFAGSVIVTQPLYMGGTLTATNRMAEIGEQIAKDNIEKMAEDVIYDTDQNYWLVVSLSHKLKLARSLNKLVASLDSDVRKMIREGVATKADGLKVAVRLNESEMAVTKAENGLALARMLLCQQCGLPLDSDITLADEQTDDIAASASENAPLPDDKTAIDTRAETRIMESAVEMTRTATKMARATNLPQAIVTGGYVVTNPNVYDSFHRSFAGMWNVGVMVRVPVWNWFEGAYRIRAAKAATTMAEYQLADAKEKMELQINQQRFKVKEANRKLAMAEKNIRSAEENLRCANLGFREGVISSTDVIGAQTAWYEAQSQKIDAEVESRMSHLGLKKALGAINQ
ncbi:MAG: TolC family protein [Prevotella sp.]